MEENTITGDTKILLSVAFKEQSGSTQTLTSLTKVSDLGITVNANATPNRPTQEEFNKALEEDERTRPSRPGEGAMARLGAKYIALNSDQGRDVGLRIREAVSEALKGGVLGDHKIDSSKYTWKDDNANKLAISSLHDDERGTVTGVPGAFYLSLSGAAVWGL